MQYTDLYVNHIDIDSKIEMARKLGIKGLGLCISTSEKEKINDFLNEIKSKRTDDVDLISCVMIDADGPKQMKNLVSLYRDRFDVVMVFGGDYSINRAAAESSKVDILMHPEFRRSDSGMDHIIANAARDNDVAIGISMHTMLTTYKKLRSQILSHHAKNLNLCHKYNVHVVIASGALSKWEMRDMRDLAGFANVLDYPIDRSMASVTDVPRTIVERNRKKMSGKVITEGVELE